MFLRVAVLVFLFLARIRFPKNESISSIVRKRYSGDVLKAVRKFEKVDYKLRKAKLDISFLVKCQNENKTVITKFLQSETKVYYKVRVRQVLQSLRDYYYKVRQVLQSVTGCYYKVRQVLQSATVITK